MSQKNKIILLIICFANVILFSNSKVKVDPQTRFIVDEYGRKRVYHGTNFVVKSFPFHPNFQEEFNVYDSLVKQDYENLRSFGLTFLRFNIPWIGLEPNKGQYNYTLLNILYQIVQQAEQNNMNILLDAHQDVYSPVLSGEGFPEWTVFDTKSFPFPLSQKPYPKNPDGTPNMQNSTLSWGVYYLAENVNEAFQNLYTNKEELSDHFANMWNIVAEKFKDQNNVLGYELINEPFFGNLYKNFSLIFNADKENLYPFYKKISQKIRENDNQTIIFFEPVVSDTIIISFNDTPEGSDYNDRQILSYHFYCLIPNSNKITKYLCNLLNSAYIKTRSEKAKQLGIPSFVTEFGNISDEQNEIESLIESMNQMDSQFSSWSYWTYKPGNYFYNSNGTVKDFVVKSLARSYFYAICGKPLQTTFSAENGQFYFKFVPEQCLNNANNEFYLGEQFYYQNGFNSEVEGCQNTQINRIEAQNYFEFVVPQQCFGQPVSITISAK